MVQDGVLRIDFHDEGEAGCEGQEIFINLEGEMVDAIQGVDSVFDQPPFTLLGGRSPLSDPLNGALKLLTSKANSCGASYPKGKIALEGVSLVAV